MAKGGYTSGYTSHCSSPLTTQYLSIPAFPTHTIPSPPPLLRAPHSFDDALRDAENCIRLKADFAKGFSRQALALFQLGRYPESEAAAKAGLAVDAGSAALKDMLAKVQIETAETPEVH